MTNRICLWVVVILFPISVALADGWSPVSDPSNDSVNLGPNSKVTPERPSSVAEESKPTTEIALRLGNESNDPDGLFGPLTYGFHAGHIFTSQWAVEFGFVRLHEPGSRALESVLDEAQVKIRAPEISIISQPVVFAATVWKNRMVDMYTSLGGLEVTRNGPLSFHFGAYTGTASREDAEGKFFGVQLGVSGTLGPIEWALSHLNGRIRESPGSLSDGVYRRSAAEVATALGIVQRLPVTVTFDVENRYFNFGTSGPTSNPKDEWIFVTGLEVHFEEVLFSSSREIGPPAL